MSRQDPHSLAPARFSRTWWLGSAKTFLWVALVSVLVWVYADVEFTDEMDLRATIHLVPAGGRTVLKSPGRVEVAFRVQGRRSSLEHLQQRLRTPGEAVVYKVTEGERDLSVRDVLNRDPLLVAEGLTVLSAAPPALRVELDRLIHVADVPVKFDYTGAIPSEPPQIAPPAVGFYVAEGDWQEVLKGLKPDEKPVLRTRQADLRTVESSKPFGVEIIARVGQANLQLDQTTVEVSVKIGQLTDAKDFTVPVQVIFPWTWTEDGTWKQYALRRREPAAWRVQIQVSGTRKDLDLLKPADILAYIVLTDDDKKPVSWLTREVQVRLPQEHDLRLVSPPPAVVFKLEKEGETPPPP